MDGRRCDARSAFYPHLPGFQLCVTLAFVVGLSIRRKREIPDVRYGSRFITRLAQSRSLARLRAAVRDATAAMLLWFGLVSAYFQCPKSNPKAAHGHSRKALVSSVRLLMQEEEPKTKSLESFLNKVVRR